MSADATGYVFRCSPLAGTALAVHLAVADSVNDQNANEFWMTVKRLALKARVSERSARDALRQMEDGGLLELVEARPGRPRLYRFLFPDAEAVYDTRGRQPLPPPPATVAAPPRQPLPPITQEKNPREPSPSAAPPSEPASPPKPRAKSARDLLWDALVLAMGWDGTSLTNGERGRLGRTVTGLLAANATAEEVAARSARYRKRWPKADLTPEALEKHWSTFAGRPPPPDRSGERDFFGRPVGWNDPEEL